MKKLLYILLSVVFIMAISFGTAFAVLPPKPAPTPTTTGSSHLSGSGNGGSTTTPGTQNGKNNGFNGTGSGNTGFPPK